MFSGPSSVLASVLHRNFQKYLKRLDQTFSDVSRRISDVCRCVRTPDSRCFLLNFVPSPAFPLTARICIHALHGSPSASPHSLVAGHSEWYCLIWPHELPTSRVNRQPACANGGPGAVALGSPRATETNNVEVEQSWPADMTERSNTSFDLISARASRLSDAADKWGSSDVDSPRIDSGTYRDVEWMLLAAIAVLHLSQTR